MADPGVVRWVRSNPPSYTVELIKNLPYNFNRLLAVVTSIEGNIERTVGTLANRFSAFRLQSGLLRSSLGTGLGT